MSFTGGHIQDKHGRIHNPDRIIYVWQQETLDTVVEDVEVETEEGGLAVKEEEVLFYPGYYGADVEDIVYELTEEGYIAALECFRVAGG